MTDANPGAPLTEPTTPDVAAPGDGPNGQIPVVSGRSHVVRVTWLVLTIGWVCLAGLYATYLAVVVAGSDFACPDPVGDSNYGEAHWSWDYMGNTCTFTHATWLRPGESVTFHSDSAWLGIVGLTCVAVTLLLLGLTGFRATRASDRERPGSVGTDRG